MGKTSVPLSFVIDESTNLLTIVGRGDFSIGDAFDTAEAIRRSPAFRPGMLTLADLTGARVKGKTHALWRLATRAHALTSSIQVPTKGALVSDDLVVYGVARMYALLAATEKQEFMAFRSLEDARRYLGLPALSGDAART